MAGAAPGGHELWEDCPLFAPEGAAVPRVPEDETAEGLAPALGALSHLLYDDESPQEISESLREEGNRLLKRGKGGYKAAIAKYTEAIRAADGVPAVAGTAYLNRAVAEFKLGNFGRALEDAEASLRLDSSSIKARYRAILSANAIAKFETAIAHCDAGLSFLKKQAAQDRGTIALFKSESGKASAGITAREAKEVEERERKEMSEEFVAARQSLLQKRKVTMGLPLFSQQRKYPRTKPVVEEGGLLWPLLLIYPEEAVGRDSGDQSDYLESVSEKSTMSDIIATIFPGGGSPLPPWDVCHRYQDATSLEILYRKDWTMPQDEADSDDEANYVGSMRGPEEVGSWITVSKTARLCDLLAKRDYVVPLFPVLYIVPKGCRLA